MSEFSESYHLRSNDTREAIELLKRAHLKGYVFPAADGWVSFVAENHNFEPDPAVIQANRGVLLHYVSAEDHGWSFSLFNAAEEKCRHDCRWENEVKIDPSRYAPEALNSLGVPIDADELTRIVSVDTLDDVFANEPSKQFAELLRLPHFDWLSFSYVERDTQNRDGSWPDAIPVS